MAAVSQQLLGVLRNALSRRHLEAPLSRTTPKLPRPWGSRAIRYRCAAAVQSFASAASHSPKPLQHKGRKDAGVEEEGGERPENGADHERAEVVAALLDRYRAAYFRDGRPEVSDDVFDALQKELGMLQEKLGRKRGKRQRVGGPVLELLEKAQHDLPMLSLAAVGSEAELMQWRQKLGNYVSSSAVRESDLCSHLSAQAIESCRWVVEPKIDGLAVRLTYRGRRLVQAATRGDGMVGEDVTHNASQIPGVPTAVESGPCGADDFEVRGEVFMTKESYRKVNDCQAASLEQPFANARNAAAGSLRLLNPSAARERCLSFVAYQLLFLQDPQGEGMTSHWEALKWLQGAGFPISPDNSLQESFAEAVEAARQWMGRRQVLGYEVDGSVLKIDDLVIRKALGSIGGDPRWAVAWKFPAQEAVAKLLGIEMSLGRSGQLTPIAVLDPVVIGGVSVARASLHNVGLVEKLGLKLGDTVIVQRAGDVIPQVVAPLIELRDGSEQPFEIPGLCPECGEPVEVTREKEAEVARCINLKCAGQEPSISSLKDLPIVSQAERLLQHFVSTCMKGLGKATLSQLLQAGLVRCAADLYDLEARQLESLKGFKAKRAAGCVSAIRKSKGAAMSVILSALGIPLVGHKAAQALQAEFGTMEALSAASVKELTAVKGVGPKIAGSVRDWFSKDPNRVHVARLMAAGVVQEEPKELRPNGQPGDEDQAAVLPLAGTSVVVTGTFQMKKLTRPEVKSLVESLGGRVASSVSSKTNLVVTGAKPGLSKLEDADRLGVPVIEEREFWRRVGQM